MRTLLHCPYGHKSEFEAVNVPMGRHGTKKPNGLRCGECKRVFVYEVYFEYVAFDPWGPPDGVIKDRKSVV